MIRPTILLFLLSILVVTAGCQSSSPHTTNYRPGTGPPSGGTCSSCH